MSKGYGLSRWELWRRDRRELRRRRRRSGEHLHLLAVHRHADWHGHCVTRDGDSTTIAMFHLLRGHDGPALLCHECVAAAADLVSHSCDRWHFHGPFRHRHTPTGR